MSFKVHNNGAWIDQKKIKYQGLNLSIDTIINNNHIENMKMLNKYILPCQSHNNLAIIVSGGPSTDFNKIKQLISQNPSAKVFCVKHSYQALIDNEIIPWACIILDARPIFGISSWGIKRSDLLFQAKAPTIFLVGTRSHPSYVYYLKKKKVDLVGFYVHAKSEVYDIFEKNGITIPTNLKNEIELSNPIEGSCAAISAIHIANHLGFNNIHLFGYDGHINHVPDVKDQNNYFYNVECNGKSFWVVRETVGLAKEFVSVVKDYTFKLKTKFSMYGEDSFMKEVFETIDLFQNDYNNDGCVTTQSSEFTNFIREQQITLNSPFKTNEANLIVCKNYQSYTTIQEKHFIETIDLLFANKIVIREICNYLEKNIRDSKDIKFGICHGVRNGVEVKLFRDFLKCKVIGTEISEYAEKFNDVIQWDFHDALDEWFVKTNFIYSNSFNHSYDPIQCLDIWMRCIADDGFLFLEWSPLHQETNQARLYGSTLQGYLNIISHNYVVKEVIDMGSYPITNVKFEALTSPIERKVIVVQHKNLVNPITVMKNQLENRR